MGRDRSSMDLTILTCNYNTPDLTNNLLKSIKQTSSKIPKIVVMNTSTNSESDNYFNDNNIPYYNYRGSTHGEAVNLGLRKIKTRYVLLVDSDIILLQDFKKPFEKFKQSGCALMGKLVENIGNKSLYPRIEPWFCFMDLQLLQKYNINFFDKDRTIKSKLENIKIYDIGSTMFEDIQKYGLSIANVDIENKYFKHYGGMSWRVAKYDPTQKDTDIDIGGTHPHKQYYDMGMQIKQKYEFETAYLNDIDIKDIFNN